MQLHFYSNPDYSCLFLGTSLKSWPYWLHNDFTMLSAPCGQPGNATGDAIIQFEASQLFRGDFSSIEDTDKFIKPQSYHPLLFTPSSNNKVCPVYAGIRYVAL